MINKKAIGERIYQIRQERGLTQDEFAQNLEVKRSAISQIENGLIAPSLELLTKIVTQFNTSFDWIINGVSSDFFKQITLSSGYLPVLTEADLFDFDNMTSTSEETVKFLKSIIKQKEIELIHSAQIMKHMEEKMQSNTKELETLKKLAALLEKQA